MAASPVDPLVPALLPPNTPATWIQDGAWRTWEWPANAIRGESKYQDVIRKLPGVAHGLVDDRLEPVVVQLVREPDNKYDRFACMSLVSDCLVGYLARECASVLAPQVDSAGVRSWCVVGGVHGADLYGVHIWLDRRLTAGPEWPPAS